MPEKTTKLPQRLSEDLERRLDHFDSAWGEGTQPVLEAYLPKQLRTEQIPVRLQWRRYVAELLSVDLEHRLRSAASTAAPRIEEYFLMVPWLSSDPAVLLELVHSEFLQRRQSGEPVESAEYERRFPQLGDAVAGCLKEAAGDLRREEPARPAVPEPSTPEETDQFDPTAAETIMSGARSDGETSRSASHNPTRSFGNYELQEEIARGGMGIVYKAWQRSANRPVAIKVILAGQFADAEDIRRFQTEAEAAANLDHPHIIPVYEVGNEGGHHFYSMALINGATLAQKVAEHPLEAREAAEIMRDVAGAIAYAHDRGIIHRDLKPANIMLEDGRTPRVTDFGLARQTNVASGVTASGQLLGSPPYMPPEQAEGRIEDVDARSDVYSMGATLYCLLAGRPPFHAATPHHTIVQVVNDDPLPPRRLNDTIPLDLENICLKCLSKVPRERYQSANELQADLDRFLKGIPTLARPIPMWERGYRFCRRRPGVATLLGTAIGSVLIALIAVTTAWITTQESAVELKKALGEKDLALEQTESAREQAETNLMQAERATYRNALRYAPTLWASGEAAAMRDYLAGMKEQLTSWDQLHGWEFDYLQELQDSEFPAIEAHDHGLCAVAWSPDGTRMATASVDGQIKIWDWFDGQLQKHRWDPEGHRALVRAIGFVEDANQLLSISDDGEARLWRKETASAAWTNTLVASKPGGILQANIAPSGRVWAWSDGSNVTIHSDDSAEELVVWDQPGSRISAMALDTSGRSVAFADQSNHTISIVPTFAEQAGTTLSSGDDNTNCWALAFSPDGQTLASGHSDGAVHIWDISDGEWQWTRTEHAKAVYGLSFGHHSNQLLTCSDDRTVRLWSLAEKQVHEVLRGHEDSVFDVELRPGGNEIATVGRDRTIRMFRPGRDHVHLEGLDSTDLAVPISDGLGMLYVADQTLKRTSFLPDDVPDNVGQIDFEIQALCRLPNQIGKHVLCGRGTLAVFDESDGLLNELSDPAVQDAVVLRAVSCSPSGRLVATGDAAGQVRIWNLITGEMIWSHRFAAGIAAVEFVSSQESFLVVDIYGMATLCELDSQAPRLTTTLSDQLLVLRCSPTQSAFAIGERASGGMRLFDVDRLREIATFVRSKHDVNDLVWSPDGRRIASAESDNKVRIWVSDPRDISSQMETALYQLDGHQQSVQRVYWTDDGSTLISIDKGGNVIRWRSSHTPN